MSCGFICCEEPGGVLLACLPAPKPYYIDHLYQILANYGLGAKPNCLFNGLIGTSHPHALHVV